MKSVTVPGWLFTILFFLALLGFITLCARCLPTSSDEDPPFQRWGLSQEAADGMFVSPAPRPKTIHNAPILELEQPSGRRFDLASRHLLKQIHGLLGPGGSHPVDAPPETTGLDVGMVYSRLYATLVDSV